MLDQTPLADSTAAVSKRQHAAWAVIGRLGSLLGGIGATMIIARWLTPADFGRFQIGRTVITGFGTFGAFGLGTVALTLFASGAINRSLGIRRLVRAATLPTTLFSIAAAGLAAWLSIRLFDQAPTAPIVGLFAFGAAAFAWGEIGSQTARSLGRVAVANLSGGLRGGLLTNGGTLLIVCLLAFSVSPHWSSALAAWVVSAAFSAMLAWIASHRWLRRRESSADQDLGTAQDRDLGREQPPSSASVLKSSTPLGLVAIVAFVANQIDILWSGWLPNDLDTAAYVAARRVVILLGVPMSIAITFLTGVIGPLWFQNRHQELNRTMRTAATAAGVPSLAAAVLVMAFPGWVLWIVLGAGYDQAATPLRLLTVGQMVIVMSGGCAPLLLICGGGRYQLAIVCVCAIVFTGLGYAAATAGSGYWLAMSATGNMIAQSIAAWWVGLRRMGVNSAFDASLVLRRQTYQTILRRR